MSKNFHSLSYLAKSQFSTTTSGLSWTEKSSSCSITNNEGIFADTSSSSFTITLPASPSIGDTLAISDYKNTWKTNNLIIDRNGEKIEGLEENLICENNQFFNLIYSGSAYGWTASAELMEANARYVRCNADDSITGDLTTTGALSYTQSSAIHVIQPQGGLYTNSNSSVTGAIKIILPQIGTNTMLRFEVDIYDYGGDVNGESIKLFVGGYCNSNSGWANVFAHVITGLTNRFYTVRFAEDGGKSVVYIGETNTVWGYPKISVSNFVGGHNNATVANWADDWAISIVTSFGSTKKISNCKLVSHYSLDSDKLDGHNSSTSATANTIALRNGSGNLYCNYSMTSHCYMSHSTSTRNSDTIFYSSTDNYMRKNNKTGFLKSLGIGAQTISTSSPSGGNAGDIWYQV